MTDNELLTARLDDCVAACADSYLLTNTNFLDIYQQSTATQYLSRKKGIKYDFYGGFAECERKVVVFLPDYAEDISYIEENPELSPIVSLKISKDNFSELSHRDYLGAIMALGIKREMLGDIVVSDKGCVVAVMRSVAVYIRENLKTVGRGSVKVEISDAFENAASDTGFEVKRCYVSSMRLDGVIAAAFNMSRNTAAERIKRGEVLMNGVVTSKPDVKVPFGAKLVIHGLGKVMVEEDAGITRKGRQAFLIKKY